MVLGLLNKKYLISLSGDMYTIHSLEIFNRYIASRFYEQLANLNVSSIGSKMKRSKSILSLGIYKVFVLLFRGVLFRILDD